MDRNYGYYGGGRQPDYSPLIFIIIIIVTIVAAVILIQTQPDIIGKIAGGFSKITLGGTKSVVDGVQSFFKISTELGAEGSLGLQEASEQTSGTLDYIRKATYVADFETNMAAVSLGYNIKALSDSIASSDENVIHTVNMKLPEYVREKFIDKQVKFSCKPKTSSYKSCQAKVDGTEFFLIDKYNDPYELRCNFFGLSQGAYKYFVNIDFPMYQFGYKELLVINDPAGLERRGYDVKAYVENDMLPNSVPISSNARNSAGPLDVEIDVPNVMAFKSNIDDEFLELNQQIPIKIINFPKGRLLGADLSFPKDTYVEKINDLILRVPEWAQLSCGPNEIKNQYQKDLDGTKWNYYEIDSDYLLAGVDGKLKENLLTITCSVSVKRSYLDKNSYNVQLFIPIEYEVYYDYHLSRPDSFQVFSDKSSSVIAKEKFVREVLFSLGRGGVENLNVKLSDAQKTFKNLLINSTYKDKTDLVNCIPIATFNNELKAAITVYDTEFKP